MRTAFVIGAIAGLCVMIFMCVETPEERARRRETGRHDDGADASRYKR